MQAHFNPTPAVAIATAAISYLTYLPALQFVATLVSILSGSLYLYNLIFKKEK
jgi:hypothetical protein